MKHYTTEEWIAVSQRGPDDICWREADGEDCIIDVPAGNPHYLYGLRGDKGGSITVTGDGGGDAIRAGDGDGDARRRGNGDGNAWRDGTGHGIAVRAGDGNGNAVRDGSGNGYAWHDGTGLLNGKHPKAWEMLEG